MTYVKKQRKWGVWVLLLLHSVQGMGGGRGVTCLADLLTGGASRTGTFPGVSELGYPATAISIGVKVKIGYVWQLSSHLFVVLCRRLAPTNRSCLCVCVRCTSGD